MQGAYLCDCYFNKTKISYRGKVVEVNFVESEEQMGLEIVPISFAEAKKRIEELKELGEVFLQLEHLSQIGSDMEGHELAQRMCQILHPELYEGQEQ